MTNTKVRKRGAQNYTAADRAKPNLSPRCDHVEVRNSFTQPKCEEPFQPIIIECLTRAKLETYVTFIYGTDHASKIRLQC
jgi:hypothetical protein